MSACQHFIFTKLIEQKLCIKFCKKLDDIHAQIIQKTLQTFGNDVMGKAQIKECYNCLPQWRHGHISVKNKEHLSWSSTRQIEELIEKV